MLIMQAYRFCGAKYLVVVVKLVIMHSFDHNLASVTPNWINHQRTLLEQWNIISHNNSTCYWDWVMENQ